MKIHKSSLVYFFSISTIFSAIFAQFFPFNNFYENIFSFIAIILFILAIFLSRKLSFILILLSSFLLILNKTSKINIEHTSLKDLIGDEVYFSASIIEDPDIINNQTKLKVKITDIYKNKNEIIYPRYSEAFLKVDQSAPFSRGDKIYLSGKVEPGFSHYPITIKNIKISEISKPDPPDLLLKLRNNFSSTIKKSLGTPNSNLILGYLIGEKTSLPESLAENIKIVGLSHIIVASGANLTIIISFFKKYLEKISRFLTFLLSILVVLIFASLVGFSSSMFRALLVAIFSLIAWYFGRKWRPSRLLAFTASLTLIYNPFYVVDLGWLLSFSAFAGILILSPIITKFFYDETPRNFISLTFIETISATILTIPLSLYFFGKISLISIFANILILPTISIAMFGGFIVGVLSFANILKIIPILITNYHLSIINFFSKQTVFLFEISKGQSGIFLLYIPIITLLIYMWYQNNKNLSPYRQVKNITILSNPPP